MRTYVTLLFILYVAYMRGHDLQDLIQKMTLQEKIGQLFVVATTSNFEQHDELLASSRITCPYRMDHAYIQYLIEQYHIGGIIFLYKSTPALQRRCTQAFQAMSKVPLLICQDGEWGLSMRLDGALEFPRNIHLGALRNKQHIYDVGKEIARQYKLLGVHMNLSPVVDCNTNPTNPVIGRRSFGSTADLVAQCGVLMMQGLQDGGVAACAKHFPGHGDTATDSHCTLPIVLHDQIRLHAIELVPFAACIQHGIAAVMTAHIMVPAYDAKKPASLSQTIVTDLLQAEYGFTGVVITDGLGMEALAAYAQPGERELQAFLAGNDILLCPLDVPAAAARIQEVIENGTVSLAYLDKKVAKILALKQQYGAAEILPNMSDDELYAQLHTPEAIALQYKVFEYKQ